LYPSPNITRVIKSRTTGGGGVCSTDGREKNAYSILVGRKEPIGRRSRRRWDGNIRMDLRKIVWELTD